LKVHFNGMAGATLYVSFTFYLNKYQVDEIPKTKTITKNKPLLIQMSNIKKLQKVKHSIISTKRINSSNTGSLQRKIPD